MGLYGLEVFGAQVTVVDDPRAIATALPDVRLTVWAAVPRIWEKLKAGIEFTVANEQDEATRTVLQWAMSVAAQRAASLVAGEQIPDELAAEWARADELVLSKLRERRGFGELRWAVSGAAPIPKETPAFFAGIGIPIAEVWGMSELSAVWRPSAIPATRAWARSASCCPGWRARSPTTASSWCAARW